jgi:hypothetical protein
LVNTNKPNLATEAIALEPFPERPARIGAFGCPIYGADTNRVYERYQMFEYQQNTVTVEPHPKSSKKQLDLFELENNRGC